MKVCFVILGWLLIPTVLCQNQTTQEEIQTIIEEAGQTLGATIKKLPDLLNRTSDWIKNLSSIGDEIHPELGDAIRMGAGVVRNASGDIPEDFSSTLQSQIKELIEGAMTIQEELKNGLQEFSIMLNNSSSSDRPNWFLDSFIPGWDNTTVEEAVSDLLPESEDVDSQFQMAIDSLKPFVDSLGNTTSTAPPPQ